MTQASSSLADTGIKLVDIVGKVANIALKIDQGAEAVENVLGPFAGFIPYYSQAMAVIRVSEPIIAKIAGAAPIAHNALELGRPLIEDAQALAPKVLPLIKQLLVNAINADPGDPREGVAAGDIGDAEAAAFAGPVLLGRPWTDDELQRWWNRDRQSFG